MSMCSSLVRTVPIFQNCDASFVNSILLHLQYEIFQEGDVIIRRNTPGECMYFIEHGQVVVETEFNQKELCDGNYFGGRYCIERSVLHSTHLNK